MSSIVIDYHSGYGYTNNVAEVLAAGSCGKLLPIDHAGNLSEQAWTTFSAADAILVTARRFGNRCASRVGGREVR